MRIDLRDDIRLKIEGRFNNGGDALISLGYSEQGIIKQNEMEYIVYENVMETNADKRRVTFVQFDYFEGKPCNIIVNPVKDN